MNAAALYEKLLTVKDTLKLKSHLFELELKDRWEDLEKRATALEAHLVQKAKQLGVAEEHYFVGSDKEIANLLEEMQDLDEQV